MAIDKSITNHSNMTENENKNPNVPARMGYLLARKTRIERWAYKGRSSSVSDTATTTSVALGTGSAQKRSESTYCQERRKLNMHLLQLSEQRQKTIEQRNFDQKLFANKQALKYKDNQNVLRTLSYVRKCCKYADSNDHEENAIDPKIFLEENSTKRSRSRSPNVTPPVIKRNLSANARTQTSASLAETFLQHNRKHLGSHTSTPLSRRLTDSKTSNTPTITIVCETPVDDDSQKRHVQFQINNDGTTHLTSQSAHMLSKPSLYDTDKTITRNIASAHAIRSSNSAPLFRTESTILDNLNEEIKSPPKRTLSRMSSIKKSLEEFRLHPERFLSASNRYLPLLRRQALDTEALNKQQREKSDMIRKRRSNFSPPFSRLSDGSDLAYDDAKSFLSEEYDITKYPTQPATAPTPVWNESDRKLEKKFRPSNKIDMMETVADDNSERQLAIARLRDREYAHLNDLIRSNQIEQILEPFSATKTNEHEKIDPKQQNILNYRQQSIQPPSSATTDPSKSTKIRELREILHSIDSLRCSDTVDKRARRQVDLEKNRAKLGILIF